MDFDDISLALQGGLDSAYLSTGVSFSLLSKTPVITHKLMPGLSSLCPTPEGLLAVFIVDDLPEHDDAGGILFYTFRKKKISGTEQAKTPHWLVQIQQGSFAWQVMTGENINGKGRPLPKAVFMKWRPGTFPSAIEKHHDMVRALPAEAFLLGSDLERVGMSSFLISEGLSSIAYTFLEEPWFKKAISGESDVEFADPCIEAIKVVDVTWDVNVEQADND